MTFSLECVYRDVSTGDFEYTTCRCERNASLMVLEFLSTDYVWYISSYENIVPTHTHTHILEKLKTYSILLSDALN